MNSFRSCHTQSSFIEDDQICGVLGGRSTLCQYCRIQAGEEHWTGGKL